MRIDEDLTLNARFDRLEKRNRRLCWAVVVLPVLGFLIGAAADVSDWKGKSVTAERFILLDPDGHQRATLSTGKDGAHFLMYDAKGQTQIHIAGDSQGNGPAVFLLGDKPDQVVATLRHFRKDGPVFPQGGPLLGLFAADEKPVIFASQSKVNGVGSIDFFDGQGNYKGGVGGSSLK